MSIEKQGVSTPNKKQIELWKKCWDFLGGTKSWEQALKNWHK